jgi:hypothetical protein
MTKSAQKREERFFAEEAARLLGRAWDLGIDREHPDFVVTEGKEQFGLEVSQIFGGKQDTRGSSLKAAEANTQRAVNKLRLTYEKIESIPLQVHFVGNMDGDNLATVVPALLAQDLPSKPVGYRFVHDTIDAHPSRARLHVFVTKGLRPNWFSGNDRAGFVYRDPHEIITAAIAKKAADIPRYQDAAGRDVRLLLIANHINNSGKLMLEVDAQFNFCGFEEVYLFPYPENVVILARPETKMPEQIEAIEKRHGVAEWINVRAHSPAPRVHCWRQVEFTFDGERSLLVNVGDAQKVARELRAAGHGNRAGMIDAAVAAAAVA